VLATWVTRQLVFDGVISGLVFGLLAVGIVLVYRSTRVINFAVGNMGLVGAALLAMTTIDHGIPFWISAAVALVVGTLYGALIELVVIRRLFTAPRVIVLVATIGVAQLSLAIVAALPDIEDPSARYPTAVGSTLDDIAGVRITGSQLAVLVTVPVVALALGWALNRTMLGRAVKASTDNPDSARLSGISPKLVSTAVWALAGLIATLTMVLVAGTSGTTRDLAVLGPGTLVRAMAAAVIARLVSIPRAVLAGVGIGVAQAVLQFNFLDQPGLIDFILLITVLAAVWFQRRSQVDESRTYSFTPVSRPIPAHLLERWWIRHMGSLTFAVFLAAAVVLPLIITQPSRHLLYATVLAFAICGVSITILIGWAGQVSLGQMAFAGLGALTAAALQRGVTVDVGWGDHRLVRGELPTVPWALAIVAATIITALLATVVGLGALRIRGLLLAVTTFALAVAAQSYLYRRPIFTGGASGTVAFRRGELFGLDLSSQRSYYYVVLAVLAVLMALVARLRRTGVARTTIAVRDNADAASAFTVRASSTQLRAFALAGAIAGLGGCLLAGTVQRVATTELFFLVDDSLALVAMVVIGGLGSLSGAVLGSLWVIGLPAFFPDNELVPLFTSSVGLLVLLLYFPGGLVQIGYAARDTVVRWVEQRNPEPEAPRRVPTRVRERRSLSEVPEAPALIACDVHVRFGGIAAVDGASIRVDHGEIVGLIGTNGAGKTTLMNAIGGYVRSTGAVAVLGREVTRTSPATRARLGLGRTFQSATLFPELTVRETIQVALEARGRTGLLSSALSLPRSIRLERTRRQEAEELIAFLGLGRHADRFVRELSTGTRRVLELAGLLALDARVLCLDEPTAGLAQRETEAFGPLIVNIRRELDASVLLIEHDMPLVMGVSDRVYCLDTGHVIAEGPPAAVRNDPRVIASYLGTDERAIARSGRRSTPAAAEIQATPVP
jgi:ABC-type branched-subunit amino acid transport system ATPase component/ABC-type branched-subunit amino acid transport system permease subunit